MDSLRPFIPPSLARAGIAIIEDSPRPTSLPSSPFALSSIPLSPRRVPDFPCDVRLESHPGTHSEPNGFRTATTSVAFFWELYAVAPMAGRDGLPIGREREAKWQSRLRPNGAEHALFYIQMIRGLVHAQVGAGRGMTNNVIQRLHCSPTHALSLSYAFVSPKQLSNQRCRQSIHLSIRFQTSENEDGWLQRRLGFVPSCFVSLVSSRKPPYATARVDTPGWLAAPLTLCDVRRSTFRLQSGGLNSTADRSKVVERC